MQAPTLTLPTFALAHISFVLSSTVLLSSLLVFGIFYLIITGILFYHWTSYGMGNHGIHVAELLFVVVSGLFFVVAFLSASYY